MTLPEIIKPDVEADASSELPDDPRLLAIVKEFLARLETGEEPDEEEYIDRHPNLANAIRTCLEGLKLMHGSIKSERPGRSFPNGIGVGSAFKPLGDFRILREIGRGGMGVVYEAVQNSLGRHVALKVLPFAAILQPRQLQRFLNEAQAAAHLHHRNIVPVFAVGNDQGVHYYAMQLVEGVSLAELIERLRHNRAQHHARHAQTSPDSGAERDGAKFSRPTCLQPTMETFSSRLSTEKSVGQSEYFHSIARFALQAAEALAYAHELGIVHRDIKPANLMIDARGKLWITDFGLAQIQNGVNLTQSGEILGTLRYMSPEQVQADHALLDQRTDIYSLGATLYDSPAAHRQ